MTDTPTERAPSGRHGLTVKEFAALWGVCTRTVDRAIGRGDIRAVHIGRSVRIPVTEVERWKRGLP